MVQIHNSETIKRILDDAGVQTSKEDVPRVLASKVVPVLISNPKRYCDVFVRDVRAVTGTGVLYTTPLDKDFYLTNAFLSNLSDVVADNTSIFLGVVLENGDSAFIIDFVKPTTTVYDNGQAVNFPTPLKLKRGSQITFSSTFTAGTSSTIANIGGYTVD